MFCFQNVRWVKYVKFRSPYAFERRLQRRCTDIDICCTSWESKRHVKDADGPSANYWKPICNFDRLRISQTITINYENMRDLNPIAAKNVLSPSLISFICICGWHLKASFLHLLFIICILASVRRCCSA